jgi:hypothetical protein
MGHLSGSLGVACHDLTKLQRGALANGDSNRLGHVAATDDNDTMYHPADTYIFCDDINEWVYDVMGATTESEAQQLIYDLAYGNGIQVSELLWHIAYAKRKEENND